MWKTNIFPGMNYSNKKLLNISKKNPYNPIINYPPTNFNVYIFYVHHNRQLECTWTAMKHDKKPSKAFIVCNLYLKLCWSPPKKKYKHNKMNINMLMAL